MRISDESSASSQIDRMFARDTLAFKLGGSGLIVCALLALAFNG